MSTLVCCSVIEASFLSLDAGLRVSTDVFVYLQCTFSSAGTYGCSLRGRLLDDKLNPEDPANLHLRIKMLAGSNLKHIHYPQHAVMRAETLGPMMCSWDSHST